MSPDYPPNAYNLLLAVQPVGMFDFLLAIPYKCIGMSYFRSLGHRHRLAASYLERRVEACQWYLVSLRLTLISRTDIVSYSHGTSDVTCLSMRYGRELDNSAYGMEMIEFQISV